jgi:hypothetical protein
MRWPVGFFHILSAFLYNMYASKMYFIFAHVFEKFF